MNAPGLRVQGPRAPVPAPRATRPVAPCRGLSRGGVGTRDADGSPGNPPAWVTAPSLPGGAWATMVAQAAVSGAVLGPLCDGQHSSHDVLHYADPVRVPLPGGASLETCWWVPVLFALAAAILQAGTVATDRALRGGGAGLPAEPRGGYSPRLTFVAAGEPRPPDGPVLPRCAPPPHPHPPRAPRAPPRPAGVALFCAQYWASGELETALASRHVLGLRDLDVFLAGTAVLHWATFDATLSGLGWAALTAVSGPALECLLVNGTGAYAYQHLDPGLETLTGTPTWICWVYFCGAPANSNLGRFFASRLRDGAPPASKGAGG